MKSLKAFTLIELLVVISIIGILSTLIVANLNSARERARDIQRKSDLKQYQSSLENFANNNSGLYPSYALISDLSALCTQVGIGNCPTDPKSEDNYVYTFRSKSGGDGTVIDATSYIFTAYLESPKTLTTPYWVVCSNGKSGESGAIADTLYTCPL